MNFQNDISDDLGIQKILYSNRILIFFFKLQLLTLSLWKIGKIRYKPTCPKQTHKFS